MEPATSALSSKARASYPRWEYGSTDQKGLAFGRQEQRSGKSQFPSGIASSVSFASTTNTARSLAGCVLLALALTLWRSPETDLAMTFRELRLNPG